MRGNMAAMNVELRRGFRLGDWEVQPLRGLLVGPEGTVHVEPKAMEVLVCLAEHRYEIVKRQTLIEAVWQEADGHDSALNHCISSLRQHLGESHLNPEYIQTVPRIGYRLIATVTPLESAADVAAGNGAGQAPPAAPKASFFEELKRRKVMRIAAVYAVVAWLVVQVAETTFPALQLPEWTITLVVILLLLGFPIALTLAWALQLTPDGILLDSRTRRDAEGTDESALRRTELVLLATMAVVAIGVVTAVLWPRADPPPDGAAANSVAVLPFQNLSDNPEDGYLSDGIAEDIRTRLAKVPELEVAARTSSRIFRANDVDAREIGERLGVARVLEGTVRRYGDRVRISAQLIDTGTGFHSWAETYDRSIEDIFSVQDDIARAVVGELKLILSPDLERRISQRPTDSVDAYDLYLQAASFARGSQNVASLDHAIGLYRRALEKDPGFALAYAGLCRTYLQKFELTDASDELAPARKACRQALDADAGLSEVQAAQGDLLLTTGQYEEALVALERAIGADPGSLDARLLMARTYEKLGRADEAERLYQEALAARPGSYVVHNELGSFLASRGRLVEAARHYRTATEIDPESAAGFNNLGNVEMMLGNFQAAASAYEQSVRLSPVGSAYNNLGTMYYYLGEFDRAVETYQKALVFTSRDYVLWGNLGDAYRFTQEQPELARAAYGEAAKLAAEALAVNPEDALTHALLGYYDVNLGDLDAARKNLDLALEKGPEQVYVYYYVALTRLELGEREAALAALSEAVGRGYPRVLLASAPEFAPLRNSSEFQSLVAPPRQ